MPIITGQWTLIEESSRLVGHSSTAVTKQLSPAGLLLAAYIVLFAAATLVSSAFATSPSFAATVNRTDLVVRSPSQRRTQTRYRRRSAPISPNAITRTTT
jgi:hypothetical protein